MAFKEIKTQEELNEVIGERLKRERDNIEKKYADYKNLQEKAQKYDDLVAADYEGKVKSLTKELEEANEKISGHNKEVADLMSRATSAESTILKTKIAHENGIPYELAGKLTGETEDEIREDAKTFSSFVASKPTPPPLHSSEPGGMSNNTDVAYQGLLNGLLGQS